jgi:hypothetical protein
MNNFGCILSLQTSCVDTAFTYSGQLLHMRRPLDWLGCILIACYGLTAQSNPFAYPRPRDRYCSTPHLTLFHAFLLFVCMRPPMRSRASKISGYRSHWPYSQMRDVSATWLSAPTIAHFILAFCSGSFFVPPCHSRGAAAFISEEKSGLFVDKQIVSRGWL